MRKKICVIAVMLVCMLALTTTVYAKDQSYIYNKYKQPVPSMPGYEAMISYEEFPCGKLNGPEDICIRKKYCFIADTNNNRIVIYDISNNGFDYVKTISTFLNDNKNDTFANPKGVFVNQEMQIYIADTNNKRIVKLDFDGNLLSVYNRPEIIVMPDDYAYFPQKVVVDDDNRMYIVATGMTEGLIQLDQNGNFIRFYGSNPVYPNMFELLFRNFLTQEQIARRSVFIPQEYSNVTISKERFIYTSTLGVQKEQIKLLNYSGKNIIRTDHLENMKYGDQASVSEFIDVAVDNSDNIYALDQKSGRIYQYNALSDLMFIFGGEGEKQGFFSKASSIAVADDNRVFVTDSKKNNLTIFNPTEFGKLVLDANDLYIEGYFKESRDNWNEILKRDSNYTLAYKSIGSAFLQEKQYQQAMKYFLDGRNFEGYSQAFEKFRTQFLRKNFNVICVVVILLIVALILLRKKIAHLYKRIVKYVG